MDYARQLLLDALTPRTTPNEGHTFAEIETLLDTIEPIHVAAPTLREAYPLMSHGAFKRIRGVTQRSPKREKLAAKNAWKRMIAQTLFEAGEIPHVPEQSTPEAPDPRYREAAYITGSQPAPPAPQTHELSWPEELDPPECIEYEYELFDPYRRVIGGPGGVLVAFSPEDPPGVDHLSDTD